MARALSFDGIALMNGKAAEAGFSLVGLLTCHKNSCNLDRRKETAMPLAYIWEHQATRAKFKSGGHKINQSGVRQEIETWTETKQVVRQQQRKTEPKCHDASRANQELHTTEIKHKPSSGLKHAGTLCERA